ncbi:hypothetical protein HCB28_13930 [Listeria sp. FSL L7-0253]|uniref:hypothetical protein n=1 Tax=Listeria cossartiae TaxID=2838249 RepID=UPI00162895F4|nr:hypothetical protein [Listeria cossartiae]MBC2187274.1 hypothetical protein [Listeria cossartiae subsp. cossartiae]
MDKMQRRLAASVDILTYLNARGEQFKLTPEGFYQHNELSNLHYDPIEKILSFTLDGEKEVATNAIEAGKLVYGFKGKEAESDIFSVIRRGGNQMNVLNKKSNNLKAVLKPSEEEMKQAKDAYMSYLTGRKFPETLKNFDWKYGLEEGLLVRMESLAEEMVLGTKWREDAELLDLIEHKQTALYSLYRGTPEQQTSSIREEYNKPAKDTIPEFQEEKGRSM